MPLRDVGTPASLPTNRLFVNGHRLGPTIQLPGGSLAGAELAGVQLTDAVFETVDFTNAVEPK